MMIPEGVEVPASAADAVQDARNAFAACRAAKADAKRVRELRRNAGRADEAAETAAMLAGEPIPTPTEPGLVAELEEAERRGRALDRVLRTALEAQCAAILTAHVEWTQVTRDKIAEIEGGIEAKLTALAADYATLSDARHLAESLARFDGSPASLDFRAPQSAAQETALARALERDAKRFSRSAPVERTAVQLVAALIGLARPEPSRSAPSHTRPDYREEDTFPRGLTVAA